MKIKVIVLLALLSLIVLSCQKVNCSLLAVAGGQQSCEVSK